MCITFDLHSLMIFSLYSLKFSAEVKVNDEVIKVLYNMRVRESTKKGDQGKKGR